MNTLWFYVELNRIAYQVCFPPFFVLLEFIKINYENNINISSYICFQGEEQNDSLLFFFRLLKIYWKTVVQYWKWIKLEHHAAIRDYII